MTDEWRKYLEKLKPYMTEKYLKALDGLPQEAKEKILAIERSKV